MPPLPNNKIEKNLKIVKFLKSWTSPAYIRVSQASAITRSGIHFIHTHCVPPFLICKAVMSYWAHKIVPKIVEVKYLDYCPAENKPTLQAHIHLYHRVAIHIHLFLFLVWLQQLLRYVTSYNSNTAICLLNSPEFMKLGGFLSHTHSYWCFPDMNTIQSTK